MLSNSKSGKSEKRLKKCSMFRQFQQKWSHFLTKKNVKSMDPAGGRPPAAAQKLHHCTRPSKNTVTHSVGNKKRKRASRQTKIFDNNTKRNSHTQPLQTIKNLKKPMPSSSTQYETLPPANINKMHATLEYDKTRT